MIEKTDAIVLKSMRYRDTSKIVTFYTRRYGKIKAIAKGARDSKSKFGAALEPMTLSSLVIYKKEQRELQLVSQCDIVKPYKRIHSEMERMAVALSIVELINQLTHDEEENLALFLLLVKTLDCLEKSERMFESHFFAFEIRLALLFGFALHLENCISCGRKLELNGAKTAYILDLSKGGIYCPTCSATAGKLGAQGHSQYRLRAEAAQSLKLLHHLDMDNIQNLEYTTEAGNELNETLRLYLQYHIEGLKPLKAAKVFQSLHV
ncbi:MAG: DNA repair protein RecO [Ignavibacteriae bacterium]|nr:DNA repair protein RecO [Ignavibacteriota bacterium]